MCEGSFSASGCKQWVMYFERVVLSQPDTIGRSGVPGLCTFDKP